MSGEFNWFASGSTTSTGTGTWGSTTSASITFTTTTAGTEWIDGSTIEWNPPTAPKPMRQGWLFDDYPNWR